jgi:hydroxymethylbilane synthase
MAQAEEARDRLCAAHPGLVVELVPVTASGDRVLDRPLAEIGGKALWTKELDAWLLAGEIDLAVHSAKDVETVRPPEIALTAVLEREDVRDVLVGVASLADLPTGARIATSAPRRAAQALHLRPDCQVVGIRGNVQTRLTRLQDGVAECTLLAKAGLNRLGMAGLGSPLDPETWLPAPGQGAIAIECRAGDAVTRDLVAAIDHRPSHQAVLAERALLAALGGTCHSPIAALTRSDGQMLVLRAAIFSSDGAHKVVGEARFAPGDPAGPTALASDLLVRASPEVRRLFEGV